MDGLQHIVDPATHNMGNPGPGSGVELDASLVVVVVDMMDIDAAGGYGGGGLVKLSWYGIPGTLLVEVAVDPWSIPNIRQRRWW